MQLVVTIGAELTDPTSRHYPFDASPVAKLPEVFGIVSNGNSNLIDVIVVP